MKMIHTKPPKKLTRGISIFLSLDMVAEIDAVAFKWDDTRSRALRRLIQVGLEHDGCDGG